MNDGNTIVWFKNDLRLHDNESLCKAIAHNQPILPIYIFDTRLHNHLPLGFRKSGYNRLQFLKESVVALQNNLKKIGGAIHIEVGLPEEIIPKLVSKYNITTIYAEDEYAEEELRVLGRLNNNLKEDCKVVLTWGKTLYHKEDIPYTIDRIPATSKAYRINTGKKAQVREPFMAPQEITVIKDFPKSKMPTDISLGYKAQTTELYVRGGENNALARLKYYTFETQQLTNYRWTRNKSLGMDYSSKFSPYLALGCISPRLVYQKVKEYERLIKKNQSTWWIIFELVWRDYFTFKGMNVGSPMFLSKGFKNKIRSWDYDKLKFKRWCDGTTGLPFIDAHMRQLNETGFMSNRGRVNCASFLVYDYNIDWTWGAAYFESKLIDYDVSANWMNWHYQAFEIWYTNSIHQSQKYKAIKFIQKYIPELSRIADERIYIPWEYDFSEYPKPIEIKQKWSRSIDKIKAMIEG